VLGLSVALLLLRRRSSAKHAAKHSALASRIASNARDDFVKRFPHVVQKLHDERSDALAVLDATMAAVAFSRSAVDVGDVMGAGRFGTRYFATVRTSKGKSLVGVVAKECPASASVAEMQLFMTEAYLLNSLKHKNMLRVVCVVSNSLPMLVATEMMQNQDLKSFLRACRPTSNNRKETLDISCLLRIGSLVVEACEFLEERRVVHRALMACNVLVGVDHRDIRLSGLDSLRETAGDDYEYVKTSTAKDQLDIRWLALESFGNQRYTSKSDVWSFGVMLWEIMSYARAPFGAFKAIEIAAEVRGGKRLERSPDCPVDLFDCMSQCWLERPADRPTFAEIRGALNLLLLTDANELRAKVEAATTMLPIADLRWEIPMSGIEILGDECGGSGNAVSGLFGGSVTIGLKKARVSAHQPNGKAKSVLALVAASSNESRFLKAVFDVAQDLRHRHLVTLLGCSSVSNFTVLFARPELGPLAEAMLSPQPTATEQDRNKIAVHVALGVEYIHANSRIHGQLSSYTVYVDAHYDAKVLAFAVSPALGDSSEAARATAVTHVTPSTAGSGDNAVRWQPAEIVLGHSPTQASDVFSYGMVLWSLFDRSGSIPYAAYASASDLVAHVQTTQTLPTLTCQAQESALQEVFDACTQPQPRDRPSMAGVTTLLLDAVGGVDRWEVDRDALTVIQKLGSGQFGEVHKMATSALSDDGSLDFVAVKTLKGEQDDSGYATAETEFLDEIELMKRLRHPNLVMMLGICTKSRPYYMILEFLKGGSLDIWLPTNGPKLNGGRKMHVVHQVALGFVALGLAGIVHRDLVGGNFRWQTFPTDMAWWCVLLDQNDGLLLDH
jgi:serine/threonine protein kinase